MTEHSQETPAQNPPDDVIGASAPTVPAQVTALELPPVLRQLDRLVAIHVVGRPVCDIKEPPEAAGYWLLDQDDLMRRVPRYSQNSDFVPLIISEMERRHGYSCQLLYGPLGTTAVFWRIDPPKELPPLVIGTGPEVQSRAVVLGALRVLCPDELAQVQALPTGTSQWQ